MPPSEPRLPFAPTLSLETRRDQVVEALSSHFANDRISLEEFERRVEVAYAAGTPARLDDLLADLPGGSTVLPGQAIAKTVSDDEIPPRGVLAAVMGGVERKGSWLVPRHLKVYAFMGGAELDLREARLAAGVTEIEVAVGMGGVEITVPPGVRVECVGGAFMGGFIVKGGDVTALSPDQPILRVSGFAVMGGVEIRTRAAGDARGRKKARRIER